MYFYLILLITALRKILLTRGMIGHNWDFSFPFLVEHFRKITLFSNYTWVDHSLGFVPTMNLSQYLPNTILVMMTHFVPPITIVKILLLVVLTASFISYRAALNYLTTEDTTNSYFALLYAFSPFIFNEIIGGSWYMWVSYAACPYLFLCLIRFIRDADMRSLPMCLIASYVAIASLQNFVCTIGIFLLYMIRYYLRPDPWGYIKRTVITSIALLLGHSFWIVNLIATFRQFTTDVITNTNFAGTFSGVRNSTHTIMDIMNLTAYIDRNLYYHVIPIWGIQLFSISVTLLWGFVLLTAYRNRSDKIMRLNLVWWLGIWALSTLVVKGGNLPLPDLTMGIFTQFPLMKLFRSPQHLMYIPAFTTPLLIALAYQTYPSNTKRRILPLLLICILIWISGWFVTGDLGAQSLATQKRDHIDIYTVSPGLQRAYHDIERSSGEGRVLFMPPVSSPLYLKTEYQGAAQGGVPEYPYLAKSTISSEQIPEVERFERMFCGGKQIDIRTFIRRYAIHQIIVRKDTQSLFSHCERIFDHKKAVAYFDTLPYLHKEILDQYVIRYTVDKKLATQIVTLSPTEKPSKTHLKWAYQKISPVEYIVTIAGAKDDLELSLLTRFNTYWKLYTLDGSTEITHGVSHRLSEGYANTWNLQPQTICLKTAGATCAYAQDSSVSFRFKIYFAQQFFLYAGLLISGITLILTLAWTFWWTRIERKRG